VYLLEGFYVFSASKSANSHKILRKFERKWVITNHVSKEVNIPKVNTWVNTFLRKYLVIYLFYVNTYKVNTFFLLLALGFYVNPILGIVGGQCSRFSLFVYLLFVCCTRDNSKLSLCTDI